MKAQQLLERILRSRVFWIVGYPLIIALAIDVSIAIIDKGLLPVRQLVVMLLYTLFFIFLQWPIYVIKGTGINIRLMSVISSIIYYLLIVIGYAMYVFFVWRIKKIDKRKLYWIAIFLLLLAILIIRGCVVSYSEHPPGFI
jgi:hypothetical protein